MNDVGTALVKITKECVVLIASGVLVLALILYGKLSDGNVSYVDDKAIRNTLSGSDRSTLCRRGMSTGPWMMRTSLTLLSQSWWSSES